MRNTLLGFFLVCIVTSVNAIENHCNVNLAMGLVVNPEHIRYLDRDRTVVQINGSDQLIIRGDVIALSSQQKELLGDFSEGIRDTVPEVVELATDAVELAMNAVTQVMVSFSETQGNSEQFREAMDSIKMGVLKRFSSSDGSYYLASQNVNEIDEYISQEFEQEIENVIASSVGSILVALGNAMSNDEGNFEDSVTAFSEKMERLGDDIELAVRERADELSVRAEGVCERLKTLDSLEDEVITMIPELARYDLIQLGK